MKQLSLVLVIMAAFFMQGFTQTHTHECGTTYFDSIEVAKDPTILERRQQLEEFTRNFLESKTDYDTVIIPVVFHVLHKYGPERISQEEIERGLDQINIDYRADNVELNNIVNDFKEIIGDAKIEFRLAKLDPDGNCTSGIVYYETDLTYNASNTLKYTITNWDPQSYLNIWTVSSIASDAAAWSHYPGVDPALDGVVTIYSYVDNGHTLSHEIGHYLNLAHPWGSTNEPGLSSNCDIDDGVEDTPNTIGVDQHCNLGMVSCGFLTNVQNFMDYSTCESMFTEGQVDRMRAALNSATSGRKYLWTDENLAETGTSDDYTNPGCSPIADIESDIYNICPGTSYTFTDFSYGSEIEKWNWNFEGGEPETSELSNPEVYFYQPGLYDVSLTVENTNGSNTVTRQNLVFVPDTLAGIIAPKTIDMEETTFPDYVGDIFRQWAFENAGNAFWTKYTNGNTSLRIKNQSNGSGTINSFITSNINLTEVTNPDYIYFDIAYAQRNSSSLDELKVFVSPDCGKKWIVKYIKSGKSLATNDGVYVTSTFEPTSTQWRTDKIDIRNYKDNNHLMVKFQVESNGGNCLYVDNIVIGGIPLVGIKNNQVSQVNVYPNPAYDKCNIYFNLSFSQLVMLKVVNVFGHEIYSERFQGAAGQNSKEIVWNQKPLKAGVYYIHILSNENQLTQPLIITN